MVNASARVQSQAAGGEIAITDAFIIALLRSQRSGPVAANITLTDELRRQILSTEVSSQIFEVKFIGEVALKGIANPKYITLVCFRGH
jgi:class 3 adenylate cyclase